MSSNEPIAAPLGQKTPPSIVNFFGNGGKDGGQLASTVFEKFGNFMDLLLECGTMDEVTRQAIKGPERPTAFLAFLGALGKIKYEHAYLGDALAKVRDDYHAEYQKGNEEGTAEIMALADRVMRTFERITKDSWKFFRPIDLGADKFTPAQRCKACRYLCLFWDIVECDPTIAKEIFSTVQTDVSSKKQLED